jgi:hypothetical protein
VIGSGVIMSRATGQEDSIRDVEDRSRP